MKHIFRYTSRIWDWVKVSPEVPSDLEGFVATLCSFVLVPTDIICSPVVLFRESRKRKLIADLFAGSYRKTHLEPYDIPSEFGPRFSKDLLERLALEFIEDQLRRSLERREGYTESCTLVEHEIDKDTAHVHLKFTRKTKDGQRDGFAAAHFFLALHLSAEDRVIHIKEVKVIKNTSPAGGPERALEFRSFAAETFHNPFDLQIDPVARVHRRNSDVTSKFRTSDLSDSVTDGIGSDTSAGISGDIEA